MQKSYFDNNTYNVIKGVAVILLYFLHFFASSDLWLPDFYLPKFRFYEEYFQYSANLCVAVFSFLTGYSFWFSAGQSFRYFYIKSLKVLKIYWMVYFVLFFIAVGSGIYSDFSFWKVVLELLGFSEDNLGGDIIAFFWYMPFYLMILFLLRLFYSFFNRVKFFLRDFIFMIVFPVILFSFFGNVFGSFFSLKRFFIDVVLWFPCAGLGYMTAKYELLEGIDNIISYFFKDRSNKIEVLISFIIIVVTFFGMYSFPGLIFNARSSLLLPIVINMSVFYILFFIYAISKCVSIANNYYVSLSLGELGKYSLYMWLFNGIFFDVFKQHTQPILIYPHYSIIILIWGLLICFALSKGFVLLVRFIHLSK